MDLREICQGCQYQRNYHWPHRRHHDGGHRPRLRNWRGFVRDHRPHRLNGHRDQGCRHLGIEDCGRRPRNRRSINNVNSAINNPGLIIY